VTKSIMSHPILFLGAGASLASGLPTTAAMTRALLSGPGFVRQTWDRYELAEGFGPEPKAEVTAITDFLPTILAVTRMRSAVTYEDLQYVLTQLQDDLMGDYDNPALKPLWERIMDFRGPLVTSRLAWDVEDFVVQSGKFLSEGAAAMIVAADDRDPKAPLAVQAAASTVEGMTTNIVTLNHDSVVERALRAAGISHTDGFDPDPLGDAPWRTGSLDQASGVRLLKLHGSVTWRREAEKERRLVRVNPRADRTRAARLEPEYEILAGTHNKILQYARAHFADLFALFRRSLRDTQSVVVAGYGFRDKAINTTLIDWMEESTGRLVVVHPDPRRLHDGARPAAARALERWNEGGRVAFLQRRAEDTSWEECRRLAAT
jgi:hypothetical protein